MTTAIVLIAPSHAVALLEDVSVGPCFFYDTGSLMAKSHLGAFIMKVRAAYSRVRYSNQHVVLFQIPPLRLSLLDGSLLGAFKHCEFDGHVG
jgi:hypothetical protein